MRALLHDGKTGYRVVDLPKPAVEAGTVIVRVRAVGICLSYIRKHGHPLDRAESLPDGYEMAGEIAEVGDGVEGWQVGDRVAVDVVGRGLSCGECIQCRMGRPRHCTHRVETWGGGFAEYIKRRAKGCYRLPDRVSFKAGALAEPFAVAIHGLRRGGFGPGENVVVLGSGTVGLAAIAVAKLWGAGSVIATAKYPAQADLAGRLGADRVFSPRDASLDKAVKEATGGLGADVVVEAVGGSSGETTEKAVALVRPLGRVIVLGGFSRPVSVDLLSPLLKEVSIVFAHCYSDAPPKEDFDLAAQALATDGLPFEDIVTHSFRFDRVDEAFLAASQKSAGAIKVQFEP